MARIDHSIYLQQTGADPFGSLSRGLEQGARLSDMAKQREYQAKEQEHLGWKRQQEMEAAAGAAKEQKMKQAKLEAAEFARIFGKADDQASWESGLKEWNRLGYSGADQIPTAPDPKFKSMVMARSMDLAEQQAKEERDREFGLKQRNAARDDRVANATVAKYNADAEEKLAAARGGGPAQKLNKEQFDAGGFAKRLEQAEAVFGDLAKTGYERGSIGQDLQKYLPGAVQGDKFKQQDQAERNFVNAALRRESGAAISPGEFENAQLQYFPRAGDSKEVLAQKAANRQQVIASIKAAAGGAYDKIETAAQAPRAEPSQQDQQAIAWAQANMNDPRAKEILRRNGVQIQAGGR